jgi:hypothetical protein
MRDMQNRVSREDIETLEKFELFKKERILKILTIANQ